MLLRVLPRFIRNQIPSRHYGNIQKALFIFIFIFFIYVYFYPTESQRVDDRGSWEKDDSLNDNDNDQGHLDIDLDVDVGRDEPEVQEDQGIMLWVDLIFR